jgi:hypothetical protein
MGLRGYTRDRSVTPGRFRQEYSRSFLLAVHAVLFEAIERLKMCSLAGCDEVAITGKLVTELNAVVDSARAPTWGFALAIHDDPPVDIGAKTGKSRPRIDIQIEKVHPGPRVRFSFEAKRLRLDSTNSIAAYVGRDGLGCFVAGRYAPGEPWGGMLGYVESGAVEEWVTRIGDKITKIQELACHSEGHWSTPDFPFKHTLCRLSRHRRANETDILVHHSFLDLSEALARPRSE